MTAKLDELKRLDCPALHEIYETIDRIRGDELQTAHKGTKIGYTRMRTKLSKIAKLCKEVRKDLLRMRDGGEKEDERQA